MLLSLYRNLSTLQSTPGKLFANGKRSPRDGSNGRGFVAFPVALRGEIGAEPAPFAAGLRVADTLRSQMSTAAPFRRHLAQVRIYPLTRSITPVIDIITFAEMSGIDALWRVTRMKQMLRGPNAISQKPSRAMGAFISTINANDAIAAFVHTV